MKQFFEKSPLIGFVFVALFAEVIFSLYRNYQGSSDNIFKEEAAAILAFKNGEEYHKRAAKLQDDIVDLAKSTEAKNTHNKLALERNGGKVKETYSEKILADKATSSNLQAQFDAWVAQEMAPIRAHFADKRARASERNALGLLKGVVLGLLFPIMALGMSYLATRHADAWRWVLLLLSFMPQWVSALNSYEGAMLAFGDRWLGYAIGATLFVCPPLLYHFSMLALKFPHAAGAQENTEPKNDNIEISHKQETTLSWPRTDEGFRQALEYLIAQRRGGNGKGLQTMLKDYFAVPAASMSRIVNAAMSSGKVVLPKNFTLEQTGTTLEQTWNNSETVPEHNETRSFTAKRGKIRPRVAG